MATLIQTVAHVSFASFVFYLWANVKHYGSQPECNHQIKFVFFFVTVRATANWLRRLQIAIYAILFPVVFYNGFVTLLAHLSADMNRTNEEEEVEETDSSSYAGNYIGMDIPLLLCVAPGFSFDEHRDSNALLFSSAIFSTVIMELTVSGRIYHIYLPFIEPWSRLREIRHTSCRMGRTLGLASSKLMIHGHSDKS